MIRIDESWAYLYGLGAHRHGMSMTRVGPSPPNGTSRTVGTIMARWLTVWRDYTTFNACMRQETTPHTALRTYLLVAVIACGLLAKAGTAKEGTLTDAGERAKTGAQADTSVRAATAESSEHSQITLRAWCVIIRGIVVSTEK